MTALVIIALAASGLLWVVAMVEFSRTWSELTRCRNMACRLLQKQEELPSLQG